MTTEEAIDIIIRRQILPPQIDYISPGDKLKNSQAEEFIDQLPNREELWIQIEQAIDNYYTEPIEIMGGVTAHYLDSLF